MRLLRDIVIVMALMTLAFGAWAGDAEYEARLKKHKGFGPFVGAQREIAVKAKAMPACNWLISKLGKPPYAVGIINSVMYNGVMAAAETFNGEIAVLKECVFWTNFIKIRQPRVP